MNPIKSKHIIDKTAADLGLPVKVVDDVVGFYYKTLQKRLSSVEHHSLLVPCLGTFVIKKKSLDEKLKKNIGFVQKIETDIDITVQTYELILQKRKDIEAYLRIMDIMNSEQQRREEVKLKKLNYGKSN